MQTYIFYKAIDVGKIVFRAANSQRTHDLRLTPLKSGLAAQETRGHSGVQPASPVRVRAVDQCPFTQAYSRGYSFQGECLRTEVRTSFSLFPYLCLVYHKIRRLSKNLCAFPPAAYVLADLEAGESTHVFS